MSKSLLRWWMVVFLSLSVFTACKTNQAHTATDQPKQPTTEVQAPTEAAAQKPASSFCDGDPAYNSLRHLDFQEVGKELPEYKQAVADRETTIIRTVGNISDPFLRNEAAAKAEIPEKPDLLESRFYDLTKKEVVRRRSAFLANHSNCYFIVGTYQLYFPDKQMAVFDLAKMNRPDAETAQQFAKTNGVGSTSGLPAHPGFLLDAP